MIKAGLCNELEENKIMKITSEQEQVLVNGIIVEYTVDYIFWGKTFLSSSSYEVA